MSRKIAFSASYFNCPPVLAILQSCDVVYTTNKYAVDVLKSNGMDIVLMNVDKSAAEFIRDFPRGDYDTFVEYPELYKTFHDWVHNDATDEQLEEWTKYFGVQSVAEIVRNPYAKAK